MDNTRIREIERVIDDYHKSHKAFTGTKEQMTYDLLTAYGDLCLCTAMAMMLNPYATDGIVQNMDALNQAIYWINYSELPKGDSELSYKISEERYEECVSLLREYAYPYSTTRENQCLIRCVSSYQKPERSSALICPEIRFQNIGILTMTWS